MHDLISPHGGSLVDLMLAGAEREAALERALHLPSWTLTPRQMCDLELLLNGGFSPLTGFMTQEEYEAVCQSMRLPDGTLWPMPITLDVTQEFADSLSEGTEIVLRDQEGFALALMEVTSRWQPDKSEEAQLVYGTLDRKHPAVSWLLDESNPVYLGGRLKGLALPHHYDFKELRHTPAELRHKFQRMGWSRIVAFQTRNPMHRAHFELTRRASAEHQANILIHPVVGLTKPGDINHFTRVRCYQKIMPRYPAGTATLSLLPLAMRMGGPREALWHAIIRKNYGCSHFIVGRDHAGPGVDSTGKPFYGPYDAQELVAQHAEELGVTLVPFRKMVYDEDRAEYRPVDEIGPEDRVLDISGTELRRRLEKGLEIPDWFSFPEVIQELRRSQPPLIERGFTVFFTGLSGAGKSTLAKGLMVKLLEDGRRPVTLLDGDIVRTHLSSELGFSKKDRSINVRRIGFVASEITKNRGIAICAPIAPYAADRRFNRELISQYGGYIEVYVATPLEVCEERDVKGLYAKARQGLIKQFTGIDDPYEPPENPDIILDTTQTSPEELVQEIILKIKQMGYL